MSYDDVEKIPFLRGTYEGMTKSERRIAEYIAADPERLMKLTIPHIAAETDSSEITVSRFCKKLGYKGLQELKQALTAYLSMNELKNYHDIKAEDTCNAVTSKIFQNIADGLLDTLQLLDYEAIDRAAAVLRQARRIAVYGFGNSATVCRDLTTR
ncbi:MAG: MurR/RpiR family transcriptional regulator, partial [Megasphaera micronuciformis]|nr:MurR/RpiR family transcriptional regulator [Megasphaera micronuciformis]